MSPRRSILLLGELLLRLNSEGFARLVQSDRFQAWYTGAEANVGVLLAAWDWEAVMVSRVPDHEIGQACLNFLRRYGIDTSQVQRGGDRLGLLYVETGASQRPSKVIYDRAGSAFTTFDDSGLDWDELFQGRRWFHFSGTAPAAAPRLVPVLERAMAAAQRQGATVSCDLNFRRKLWSPAEARQVMSRLMAQVDVLICNEEDAGNVFGIKARDTDVVDGRLSSAGYEQVAGQLHANFGFSHIAITLRESLSASRNLWSALLYTAGRASFSRKYDIQIVDRIGTGDSFAAGLIHGLAEGWDASRAVGFAVAASCLKHTIPGDFNLVTREEVEALLSGDGSGRIQR